MTYTKCKMPEAGDTVVVGMSGGVDSTLTALSLLEKGCKVIGATMSLWDGKLPEGIDPEKLPSSCYGPAELKNIEECRQFCKEHNIEYHVIDVKKIYHDEVLEYFKSEYRSGRTPNPCIQCNRKVKFGALLKGLEASGIHYDYFCTGHYASVVQPDEGMYGTEERPYMICTAADVTKDQTYFLYRVPSDVLKKVRFPLGDSLKKDVFEQAKKKNLAAAARAESQDFIPSEYFDMLFSDKPSIPGDIIDLDGKVLGKHRGIEHYTIGQRRGLGVAVSYPVYVQSIDPVNNVVVLAPNDALNSISLIADNFVWAGNVEPVEKITIMAKIRLASKPAAATVEKISDEEWKITFEQEQRAVAPGQSVVLYCDGVILGGGLIKSVLK